MSTKHHHKPAGIKETLTSLIIAFMLAFLFRGFVIEGFVIPTGSMAPTLMGKHMQITSPANGYQWAVGPWDTYGRSREPLKLQGSKNPIGINDPMSGQRISKANVKLSAGDRVFVLKYLPFLHTPERWDVVVFKNPGTHQNYIKRLIGRPGEQVALVDGDVFVRQYVEGTTARIGWESWQEDSWAIARKPERVQRTMFQPVYNARYAPITPDPSFRSPLKGSTPAWEGLATSTYTYSGSGPTALNWTGDRPITDRYPYNQINQYYDLFAQPNDQLARTTARPFPVSDIAMSLNIKPSDAPVMVTPTIMARSMGFRAVIDPATNAVSVEIKPDQESETPWSVLDMGEIHGIKPGSFTRVEFWHVDQALWLFVDGQLVCGGPETGGYALSPAQRAELATIYSYKQLRQDSSVGNGVTRAGVLARPDLYRQPKLGWGFEGGAFTLSNVEIKRDISYQISPPEVNGSMPTRGAHPDFFPTLTPDEFFMCGDNSPRSADGRMWTEDSIVPWVREHIDATAGVVHRDLVVGKAFVVYFPSLIKDAPIPTPDLGKVRWIW